MAAEACYLKSCYLKYLRHIPDAMDQQEEQSGYTIQENTAYEMLYADIRETIFKTPDVMYMCDFISKLTGFLTELGITNVQPSTKKNMRRKVESEFGASLHIFPDERGKLLMVPNNFTTECLAKQNVKLKEELRLLKRKTSAMPPLEKKPLHPAKCLRTDIRAIKTNHPWPPNPEELTEDFVRLPDSLVKFLTFLLAKTKWKCQTVCNVWYGHWSIAQDVVYGVTAGATLTSKQILSLNIFYCKGNRIKQGKNATSALFLIQDLQHPRL